MTTPFVTTRERARMIRAERDAAGMSPPVSLADAEKIAGRYLAGDDATPSRIKSTGRALWLQTLAAAGRFKVSLKETARGRHMLERTKRFDVLLNGQPIGEQLYWNTRGYRGALPLPDGHMLDPGEIGITGFRREVARINREARA